MDPLLLIINFVLPIELFIYFNFKGCKIYVHHFVFFYIFYFKAQFILILFYNHLIEGDILFLITTTEESPIVELIINFFVH
jgi:hypothetical protein